MIKIKDVKKVQTEVEISYTPEVKTYDIMTGFMTDDCRPYKVTISTMLWIDEQGYFGEIECIYSEKVQEFLCRDACNVMEVFGFPQFEVISCDNEEYIQDFEDGYIIWLLNDKLIDTKIIYSDLIFFISDSELVGILTKHAKVE